MGHMWFGVGTPLKGIEMPVSLYHDGDEEEEGLIAVQGHFEPMNCVRVNLCDMNTEKILTSFIVMRGIGDPELPQNKAVMELSNATSVNLWYSIGDAGFDLVRDVDMVIDLEQCLAHYEEHRKATLQ